jgi:hypothetical protein
MKRPFIGWRITGYPTSGDLVLYNVTGNAANDLLTIVSSSLDIPSGYPVMFQNLAPDNAGIANNTLYFARDTAPGVLRVATVPNGPPVDITANIVSGNLRYMIGFTPLLPMGLWLPDEVYEGGERVSGAGVPNGYLLRTDDVCTVQIRFLETEWADVVSTFKWMMENKHIPFPFRFDWFNPATEYWCYLNSPKLGERLRPVRDPQYPRAMMITAELRAWAPRSGAFTTPVR